MSKAEIAEMKRIVGQRGRRRRLTDHEKTIETLKTLQPVLVQGLGVARDIVSIPAVGIGVTWWSMNMVRTFWNRGKPSRDHIDTHAIESALGVAMIAAAVVPAAKAAAEIMGPLGALFGPLLGGMGGGSPLG